MEVRSLFEEMQREGVRVDSAVLHAIVKALANHPDYLLRSEILMMMREHWFNLSAMGWHDVVVGLLREKQMELAIDTLEHMRAQKIRTEAWLYSLIVYTLCELREFDEVVRMLRMMIDEDVHMKPTVWFHVLDIAGQNHHVHSPPSPNAAQG
jgi:pentatricopeptide repeat protein